MQVRLDESQPVSLVLAVRLEHFPRRGGATTGTVRDFLAIPACVAVGVDSSDEEPEVAVGSVEHDALPAAKIRREDRVRGDVAQGAGGGHSDHSLGSSRNS